MLKYIQDLDFGKIEPQGTLRQKKIFNMKMPLQQLIKNRSVSQLLHEELVTLQKSSARKHKRNDSVRNDLSPSITIRPIEQLQQSIILPQIGTKEIQICIPKQKRRKQFVLKQQDQSDNEQWTSAYYNDKSPGFSSPIKEIKRVLQDSFVDKKLQQSFTQSQIKQNAISESPKKKQNSTNDRFMRCLLAEYVIAEKVQFIDLLPQTKIQLREVEYMFEQVCMNFELMRQLFRLERTITKVLLKTSGITKKIILTFFKEIKPNCPNDVTQFEQYFKLRKQISKDFLQVKFIIGHEPENDQIIRKLILRNVDAFSQFQIRNQIEDSYQTSLKQMEPSALLLECLENVKFDYDYLNKLNYFNLNLQEQIKQKQIKNIKSKLQNSDILDSTQTISYDFDQQESILERITNCERRLGKFQKISNKERFKYMEADAYLLYR